MFPGGGGDLFGMMNQMNQMMNGMLNDPFFTGMPPHMVCNRCTAARLLGRILLLTQTRCSQMQQQQYPQHQQTVPRVEEVPQHTQQRAARSSGGPIVEEPDGETTVCFPQLFPS